MSEPTNLNATRQDWILAEIVTALEGGRWRDSDALVARVRKRFEWATDREIWSAVDQLHEEGRIDARNTTRRGAPGDRDPETHLTQWKLLPPPKTRAT